MMISIQGFKQFIKNLNLSNSLTIFFERYNRGKFQRGTMSKVAFGSGKRMPTAVLKILDSIDAPSHFLIPCYLLPSCTQVPSIKLDVELWEEGTGHLTMLWLKMVPLLQSALWSLHCIWHSINQAVGWSTYWIKGAPYKTVMQWKIKLPKNVIDIAFKKLNIYKKWESYWLHMVQKNKEKTKSSKKYGSLDDINSLPIHDKKQLAMKVRTFQQCKQGYVKNL